MRPDNVVVISGSRDWADEAAIYYFLVQFDPYWTLVFHGKARGADSIADRIATSLGFGVVSFPANWRPSGPNGPLDYSAGPRRNKVMISVAAAQLQYGVQVYAGIFLLPQSRGTKHAKDLCEKARFHMHVVHGRL